MASDRKSQEELEKPAKVYQIDALDTKLDTVITKLEEQSTYMQGTVTVSYLHEQLKGLEDKIKARYDPTLNNTRWVAKTAIGAFVSVTLLVIGVYLKS